MPYTISQTRGSYKLKGKIQGTLNEAMETLTQKNIALEAMLVALREKIKKLNNELSACKAAIGGGVLAVMPTHQMDMPKPKDFKGT